MESLPVFAALHYEEGGQAGAPGTHSNRLAFRAGPRRVVSAPWREAAATVSTLAWVVALLPRPAMVQPAGGTPPAALVRAEDVTHITSAGDAAAVLSGIEPRTRC